jgi:transposase
MKYFLAFKYTTVFSRELDGTGVNVSGEIGFEIIERASVRIIAEDFTQVRNISPQSLK